MTHVKKLYPAEFKVIDATKGIVEQYVSVFENVDHIGDRVKQGFFKQDVDAFAAGDAAFPVIYSHNWDKLDYWIGEVTELEEVAAGDARLPEKIKTLGGLRTLYQFYMDEPAARKVLKLMQRKLLRQASFSYDVEEEKRANDGANDLIKGRMIEVGPTLRGMNDLTDTTDVKALVPTPEDVRAKAGRVLSAKNESDLRQAAELITAVLAQAQESNSDTPSGKAEEPDRANASREATGAEEPSGANAPKRTLFEMELDLAVGGFPSA